MNEFDRAYHTLVMDVAQSGDFLEGRNGAIYELFGAMISFNLQKGFPALQGRKLFPRGVFGELSAFLKASTHVSQFHDEGCRYWDMWADDDGNLGKIYGYQWRKWGEEQFDQLQWLVENLKAHPESRQLIVTAWNPTDMDDMALPPCYPTFQARVHKGKLNILVNQRSADIMIGLPSDVMFFATLTQLLCNETGLEPGTLTFAIGSAHIYAPHIPGVMTFLNRAGYADSYPWLRHHNMTLEDFDPDRIGIVRYKPLDPIAFELFQ